MTYCAVICSKGSNLQAFGVEVRDLKKSGRAISYSGVYQNGRQVLSSRNITRDEIGHCWTCPCNSEPEKEIGRWEYNGDEYKLFMDNFMFSFSLIQNGSEVATQKPAGEWFDHKYSFIGWQGLIFVLLFLIIVGVVAITNGQLPDALWPVVVGFGAVGAIAGPVLLILSCCGKQYSDRFETAPLLATNTNVETMS
eukprot:TRINITY_DN1854_c0_g1_i2.p1 TRINITY_DN1854_c0_g1~~TRINITY_DN1854_c0_g1_i2.p1  ORF type:complete len:195 (+),score=18.49 TRINITY_DN1854_c0_g1_i2:42-626(+)